MSLKFPAVVTQVVVSLGGVLILVSLFLWFAKGVFVVGDWFAKVDSLEEMEGSLVSL